MASTMRQPKHWREWNYQYATEWTTTSTTTVYPVAGTRDAWGQWNYIYSVNGSTVISPNQTMTVMDYNNPWHWDETEVTGGGWVRWNITYTETEEQKRLREEREAIARAQAEERRLEAIERARVAHEERQAAEAKARELLLSVLDAQQKRDLLEHGWFEVVSNKGRRWRIRANGIAGNVDLMPEDENDEVRLASFCAHPSNRDGVLPNSDHFLAQKLVLETDEDRFTNVAYIHHRRAGVREEDLRPAV